MWLGAIWDQHVRDQHHPIGNFICTDLTVRWAILAETLTYYYREVRLFAGSTPLAGLVQALDTHN